MRTGRSRPLWCSGAAGKKEEVGCIPGGAGGGAPQRDSAVVAAQPRPLCHKRSAYHRTQVRVVLAKQEAPTGEGEAATPWSSKRIAVLCTHLVGWSSFTALDSTR